MILEAPKASILFSLNMIIDAETLGKLWHIASLYIHDKSDHFHLEQASCSTYLELATLHFQLKTFHLQEQLYPLQLAPIPTELILLSSRRQK